MWVTFNTLKTEEAKGNGLFRDILQAQRSQNNYSTLVGPFSAYTRLDIFRFNVGI